MPRILVKETDRTSPGTPDSYSNYSILITGFAKNPVDKKIYEFSSVKNFKETIGLCSPTQKHPELDLTIKHYGNQMAYELLNMGYPIIYKVITFKNIEDISFENSIESELIADLKNEGIIADNYDEASIKKDLQEILSFENNIGEPLVTEAAFWEEFKDKASYDFRFITHGFLESNDKNESSSLKKSIFDAMCALYALNYLEDFVESTNSSGTNTFDISNLYNDLYVALEKKNTDPSDADFAKDFCETYGEELLNNNKLKVFLNTPEILIENQCTTFNQAQEYFKRMLEDSCRKKAVCVSTQTINSVNNCIADLAEYADTDDTETNTESFSGRGDCVALIELDEQLYTDTQATNKPEIQIIDAINDMTFIDKSNGKYCAMTVPSVTYKMTDNEDFDNNKKFPGAFHYLACFINSLKSNFAEWYAAAGYTRGVSSYMVDYATVKLGEIAINALEPRNFDDPQENYPKFACNVIANFRGSYYLWGNRTAHPLGKKGNLDDGDLVASHFLNIRQLCTTIKKQLYVACRKYTFDPNSDTLWVNFCNSIRPTLEVMKADQGIRDYKIIKEFTDKKATLSAKIRIIPIEAVEDFELTVRLEDSFGEITVNTVE